MGDTLALAYTYSDIGYDVGMKCIRNTSSEFTTSPEEGTFLYPVTGYLPDSSPGMPEYSVYVGHGTVAIVAMGVTYAPIDPGSRIRYVAIAAGEDYQNLNNVQCVADFVPRSFNVSVSLQGRNITITPLSSPSPVADIEPSRNLSHTVMRQLEIIANDQTNFYTSLVGDSLNASVSDYKASLPISTSLNADGITLAGVTNSMNAMLDDMLVAYGSAQLMIAKDAVEISARVERHAIQLGEGIYIYSTFAVNCLVLLLVLTEIIRTRAWRDMVAFDYADPIALVIGSSAGGREVADEVIAVCTTSSHIVGTGSTLWKDNGLRSEASEVQVILRSDDEGNFMIQSASVAQTP